MISPSLMTRIRSDLDDWEEPTPWMYLDSTGNITVGCGTMLPTLNSARVIPFYHDKTRVLATGQEIEAEWKSLSIGSAAQKAAPPTQKFAAGHYQKHSDLRITDETAWDLRDVHIEADYDTLRQIYDGFDDFPEDAQVALFDMIYNVGGGRAGSPHHRASGMQRFGLMNAAIADGDWIKASRHCHRGGIPDARNAETARLFRDSAIHTEAAPWRTQRPLL